MIKAAALVALAAFASAGPAGGWRPLFDGKTTAGWRGYRQQQIPDGWRVENGALTTSGKAGDIVSADQFEDFELVLEWKIAPGGNSGVFYRVTEEDPVLWHTAPEMQLIDDRGYKGPLKDTQKTGANYDLHPPASDATRPAGAWNESRILVRNDHVEHWLNGTKVVEYELGSPDWEARVTQSKFKEYARYGKARRGHIAIQDHGDAISFRTIRIREL